MNPYQERTLVITVRADRGLGNPGIWLTLYDSLDVEIGKMIGVRGELWTEDFPFGVADALADLLHVESSRHPRLI